MLYYFIILYHSIHSCFFVCKNTNFWQYPKILPIICRIKIHHPLPAKEFRAAPKPLSCAWQCSVATIPLRYINAPGIAIPNPAGLVEVLHIVFIPSAAQAKAAAIRRYGRSQALPTLTNSLSSYRSLRPDNYLPLQRVTAPRLRRHTPPLQSAETTGHLLVSRPTGDITQRRVSLHAHALAAEGEVC